MPGRARPGRRRRTRLDLDLGSTRSIGACGHPRSSARTPRGSRRRSARRQAEGFSTTVARPWPTPMHIVARPQPRAAAAHLPHQRGQQARAGAAERVAERDRAAVHVQPLAVDAQLAHAREHLGGEGLVQLHEVDVRDVEPGAFERAAGGGHRADAHVARVDAGRAARRRSAPAARGRARCALLGRQHDTRAPSLICDELPAVTVPPSRNAGRSLASRSSVVSGARALVGVDGDRARPSAAAPAPARSPRRSGPASRGGHRAPVALQRELVLVGTLDRRTARRRSRPSRPSSRCGPAPPCAGW